MRKHRELKPPLDFWTRPEVVDALARRDIGAVLRTDISLMTGLPQPHVSELERGVRRVTSLSVFERIADGLDIPRSLLGMAEPADLPAVPGHLDPAVQASQRDWLHTRQQLNRNRSMLTQLAAALYPESDRLGTTGVLMRPDWRLAVPLPLDETELLLADTPRPLVTGREDESRRLRPLVAPGRHYDRYRTAVRDLNRPRLFENRVAYRLLDADWHAGPGLIAVGYMRYFDMIDLGEALAHEIALVSVDREGHVRPDRATWDNLPLRRLLRDPFDLAAYPVLFSISTLTIRRSRAGATFLLLRRGVDRVAIAGGMLSVMPTGVFQPASILPAPESPDFDLWRNMMREYSEEFLGNPEHDGNGDTIDYANEEPFRSLDSARQAGKVRVYCLGAGIDALNLVGDLFSVAVFDADIFDRVFDGLVEHNDEGMVMMGGQGAERYSFDPTTVDQLLTAESVAPSGAACLRLALEHRDLILG